MTKLTKAQLHARISYLKSAIRIAGYLYLWSIAPWASAVLVASELLGIGEEVFGA